MLDTEESSDATDEDYSKLASSNPYLRLMALSKAKRVLNQYILQDIDGCDTKLLSGLYQRRVFGYEELPEEQPFILDKISEAKQVASQMAKKMPHEPDIQIKEEAESEEQPESDDTDVNREKKRWEPTTKYSKYMASYFRK